MKSKILLATLLVFAGSLSAFSQNYETLKAEAEKFFSEGSFARAHELYRRAAELPGISPDEKRWAAFRVADTQWRSQAATQTADNTAFEEAQRRLEALVRDVNRPEDRDRLWVEAQESLGDFFWTRRNSQNYGAAWPCYQHALDWWAGAPDIELARQRYLQIVWRMVRPPRAEPYSYYGYWGNYVPLDILENTLKIVRTDNDRAHAHYLIAMTVQHQGGWEDRARVPEEFEAALKGGRSLDWYDDALFYYAQWMENQGRIVPLANGGWQHEPDYVKALELYRRIVAEFKKGETRYWDQVQQRIEEITAPEVGLGVPNIYLPDSEIQFHLNWRNVKRLEFALYAVELNRDVRFAGDGTGTGDWAQRIDVGRLERIKEWTRDTGDRGVYAPSNEVARLDGKLKPGAYLLVARGGGKTASDVILVTDASLVLKTSGRQALVYFCNALNSAPLANSSVKLWQGWWENSEWRWKMMEKTTDKDGLALFELDRRADSNVQFFASAINGDRQAFSVENSHWGRNNSEPWRVYAFTDRPAYRPEETVNWKFVARRYNGSVYSTPADAVIEFEITDPRGAKVKADKATLNAFGSAWGSLALTPEMPLGEYQITFFDQGRKNHIGAATLFRLEEYKLPEFKVSVNTPEETGPDKIPRRKAFLLGDKVEVTIQADYYFGGPVANASVEVLVHQNPYYQTWQRPRDYPWFYEDIDQSYGRWQRGYGGGQVIKREVIRTDATGKALLTFETPRNGGQDFEYRIEARVTDSSRREITGNGTVRVTRQRYYVYPQAAHNLYRPQDQVTVDFKALDANEQPVSAEGMVKVTRDYWFEIWLAPDGREVKGEELHQLQSRALIWPPLPPRPDGPGWQLKFRGYQHDDILTRSLKTDTNGEAQITFTPEREGYYRVAWTSQDSVADRPSPVVNPITADTTVWVANNATIELGYRSGAVQIIADKDTFRVGQKAPVMLVTPSSDRYVLFTVEGDDLYSYQLVHLDGTVKLLELAMEEKHVPNIFLSAVLVSDRQIFMDTKQIIVPPTKNFLAVEVKADREQYQPREEGTFVITTKDDNGRPVSTEVAFGLVDESVFYIQSDYAGDPRKFFFGTKRNRQIETQATMNLKSYVKLVQGKDDLLMDDREQERNGRKDYDGEYDALQEKSEVLSRGSRSRFAKLGAMGIGGAVPAAPAAMPMSTMSAREASLDDRNELRAASGLDLPAGANQEPAVVVRSDFRSTILWQPDVVTDKDGKATVKVKYPDSLTGWKATARAASAANQFGIADCATRTKQPLIVRLQAPRFFVVGDEVVVSAVVNNNTDKELIVKPQLETGGVLSGTRFEPAATLTVPANGEARANWKLAIQKAGEVKLKVSGRGGAYADAMEKTYIAHEHGIEKFIAKSGKARGHDITVKLDLPNERKPGSTSVTVQLTPSMAVTMLDALPYLIDYPYGCTEQTMSRFLPAVITAKTLRDLGLQPEDIMGRVFGGIETNSAAVTHPRGKRDLAELDKIEKAGLERLYDFQHGDGGWGWWKQGESDHWMTAYVVWGLSLARDAGVRIKEEALNRGAEFLRKEIVEQEENPDLQSWMLHAYAVCHARNRGKPGPEIVKASDNLWANREQLNAYTRALLALATHSLGQNDRAKVLVENLENGVKRDARPDTSVLISGPSTPDSTVLGTAHWGEDGIYWRWSDGGVETTAFALRALLAIDPTNKLVEPVTNWLIKNRRGVQWNSTRDTAIVVLALNDYLRASGELKTDVEYELLVNGTPIAKRKISGADVFAAPSRFAIDPKLVRDRNEVRIKCTPARGASAPSLYFAAEAKFFSTEEPVTPAGNEIFVKREYYKLVGRPTLLKGYVYEREPLRDGDHVKSGERVETVITIEGKNNYEYLIFEDLKPAGLEAVEVRSGEPLFARELKSGAVTNSEIRTPHSALDQTGRTRWIHQELRDRKIALFVDKLPEGVWQLRYDLRAEVPGRFHALPVLGYAMYVPEIRCNGAELRIQVVDGDAN